MLIRGVSNFNIHSHLCESFDKLIANSLSYFIV